MAEIHLRPISAEGEFQREEGISRDVPVSSAWLVFDFRKFNFEQWSEEKIQSAARPLRMPREKNRGRERERERERERNVVLVCKSVSDRCERTGH